MLIDILLLLLQFIGDTFAFALLARFLMQWRRVQFRNSLGFFVIRVTDWIVVPTRRVIPSLFGLDIASLLLTWLEQIAYQWLVVALTRQMITTPLGFGVLAFDAVFEILRLLLWLLTAAALLLWINPRLSFATVLHKVVEPFYAPVRGKLPPIYGFDLSPALFLLLIQIALYGVAKIHGALFSVLFS